MPVLPALGLMACLAGSHFELANPPIGNPARMVVRHPGGDRNEAGGALVSDPGAAEIRFENKKGVVVTIPYSQVTALHAEDARALHFTRVHDYYFVVHYTGTGGGPQFLVVRLGSQTAYESLISLFEHDVRQRVSRSAAWRSIAGVPIYAAVGENVVAVGQAYTGPGTLTAISNDRVTIQGSGTTHQFDASTLPVLRRPFRLAPLVKKAFLAGFTAGAGLGVLYVHSESEHAWLPGSSALAAVYFGSIAGAGFALGEATSAPGHYAMNPSYDIYRGAPTKSSGPGVAVAPVITKDSKALNVVIRWR